jgi:peptide chain release factor subunit 1
MRETAVQARRLLEQTGDHPVVSVYFDLDPTEFATAPARATQVHSLLDEVQRPGDGELDHEDRMAVEEDLKRIESYLLSDDLPVSGTRAVALFASSGDSLFESVPMSRPAQPRLVIAPTPYVEPLVVGHDPGRWCAALVSRRVGRIFAGSADELSERRDVKDNVHGQHHQGGWSQANYERSVEADAEHHMRDVAAELYRQWQQEPFQKLVLGGTIEDVRRFADDLHNDLRPTLVSERLDLNPQTASPVEVQAAVLPLVEQEAVRTESEALSELANRIGAGGAAATGLDDVLEALTERRVQTLLLGQGFTAAGGRCPSCGLLTTEREGSCPADGTPLVPVADLREAAVQAALIQDAEVLVIEEEPSELRRGSGIAALLRY